MEGLSAAANGLAVVSAAFQLTEACIKLYRFWESIDDAPYEIAAIKEDLQYLISVFTKVDSKDDPPGQCITEGIRHCQVKITELMLIVERYEIGFQSTSRKRRAWAAFKAAIHSSHVQRFRDSLNETKATLTLAMIHESIVQVRATNVVTSLDVINGLNRDYITQNLQLLLHGPQSAAWDPTQSHASKLVKARPFHKEISRYDLLATNKLMHFKKPLPEQGRGKYHIQELMLNAIAQTAIGTFESTSLEIFAQDGYMIDGCGQLRSKTFVYAENVRYRVRHNTSSFRTALGCLWVRTTTIYLSNDSEDHAAKSQTVVSFVFYPTVCLKWLGFRKGLEAIVASAGQSWLFNCRITLTHAVPEDSLIFELCRTGQTRAVEILLDKRLASVVDTSPKGWKPLHFAAAAGHVELCAMLIRAGADKSALVYEGPSESILSPISLFVACSGKSHAERKIAMLRMFCDCIDLASPESDGWQVHDWLKRAYAREKVPISQNSITWLLSMTANEEYVECSPRNIWSALQHAVRSILNHERYSRYLERLLNLSGHEQRKICQRQMDALGYWIALRVSGRALLPMVLHVGSFLQMRGFDWIEDHMPHREFLQAQPNLYAAWCHAVLDAVEKLEGYMRQELHLCLQQLGWTREDLISALSYPGITSDPADSHNYRQQICSNCEQDFGPLGQTLVEPARIAVNECVKTGHNSDCVCQGIGKAQNMIDELPEYTGQCRGKDDEEDELAFEIEFFDAEPHIFKPSTILGRPDFNMFTEVASLLHRAQGRVWMNSYAIDERICSTCLLLKEQYIFHDGFAAEFPPMPRSFEGLRPKW